MFSTNENEDPLTDTEAVEDCVRELVERVSDEQSESCDLKELLARVKAATERCKAFEEEDSEEDEDEENCRGNGSLYVRCLALFNEIFAFATMTRLLFAFTICISTSFLWSTILEVYSRPTIVRARSPRPFFPNSSAAYIADFYTGAIHPGRLLERSDLLIVMYYSPWSTQAKHTKHFFEVSARLLHNHKKIKFAGINCFQSGSQCRKIYKMYRYPVFIAYANNIVNVYQGEFATDHIYRWIANQASPFVRINNEEDVANYLRTNRHVVVGYYPFTNMETPEGYRVFGASSMLMQTGKPGDDLVVHGVVTDRVLAKQLGFQHAGEILMLSPQGNTYYFHGNMLAENINGWIRDQLREEWFSLSQWIQFNKHNVDVKSEDFPRLSNDSAILLLVTEHDPIYQSQNDLTAFNELAREYWNCGGAELEPELLNTSGDCGSDMYAEDETACELISEGIYELDACCRAQKDNIDWNMACASSAKYSWESEEVEKTETEGERRRRSVWLEQTLPSKPECASVEKRKSANLFIARCCENLESIRSPHFGRDHIALMNDSLYRHELTYVDQCMRSRLAKYMHIKKMSILDDRDSEEKINVTGFGCTKNNTFSFVTMDRKHYGFYLDKWGLSRQNQTKPFVIAIDSSREIFDVFGYKDEEVVDSYSLRRFVQGYHELDITDHMLSEELTRSRFLTNELSEQLSNGQTFKRITQSQFNDIVRQKNRDRNFVIFFSGGGWHAPSTAAIHAVLKTADYFKDLAQFIDFYIIDTSRNELSYNFNFERLPALVFFLADGSGRSWKLPDTLPITRTQIISFILSHCSSDLKWATAIVKCTTRTCRSRNRKVLRRKARILLRDIHHMRGASSVDEDILQRKVSLLRNTRLLNSLTNNWYNNVNDEQLMKKMVAIFNSMH